MLFTRSSDTKMGPMHQVVTSEGHLKIVNGGVVLLTKVKYKLKLNRKLLWAGRRIILLKRIFFFI